MTTTTAPSRPIRSFVLHYAEMLVAMTVGMVALAPLWSAVWPGYADRPDTMALAMATDMTVAMAGWMAVRGHGRRGIALMSAAMCAPFALLVLPYWAGLLPGDWLLPLGHVIMLPLMAVAMLVPGGRHDHG
jgi:peptidoglycan/LPS O-acetylase OafA/YrhL